MPKKTILIVEDDPDNLKACTRWLEAHGYAVVGVRTAEAAIAAAGDASVSVILLDNLLPGMTGMQAIPQLSKSSKAPIVMMTTQAGDDVRQEALRRGARSLLRKPLNFPGLADEIAAASA